MSNIAFVFSGQGSQYIGMGKELYDNFIICRDVFDKADKILDFPISKLCFEGNKEELDKTENTQPAILTLSYSIFKLLCEKNIKPKAMAGFSLGEYSALVCANVIDFENGLELIRKRGKFMDEAVPNNKGTMAAIIGIDEDKVREVVNECKEFGFIDISNLNCPKQTVVGGEREAVLRACEVAKTKGAFKAVELAVSGPFHTKMLEEAAGKLEKELTKVEFSKPIVPIVSNCTGEYAKYEDIKGLLKRQVTSTVLWEKSIRMMIDDGIDTFIEIGPGKTLINLIKKIDRGVKIFNIEDIKTLENTLKNLKN